MRFNPMRASEVLTQMTVHLANVISDLSRLIGQTIVRAMLGGERDPIRRRVAI
jgi:hypothetical protein